MLMLLRGQGHVFPPVTSLLVWFRTSSRPENHVKWFIYLTNWAFLLLNVNLLVHAVVTVVEYFRQRSRGGERGGGGLWAERGCGHAGCGGGVGWCGLGWGGIGCGR